MKWIGAGGGGVWMLLGSDAVQSSSDFFQTNTLLSSKQCSSISKSEFSRSALNQKCAFDVQK
jgi:hypothetical protein